MKHRTTYVLSKQSSEDRDTSFKSLSDIHIKDFLYRGTTANRKYSKDEKIKSPRLEMSQGYKIVHNKMASNNIEDPDSLERINNDKNDLKMITINTFTKSMHMNN